MTSATTRSKPRLSLAASRRFVGQVRSHFGPMARPVVALTRVLCCSRNTARRILKSKQIDFCIRDAYAARFAKHLGISKTALLGKQEDVTEDLFKTWAEMGDPYQARIAARSLGDYAERIALQSYGLPCDLIRKGRNDNSVAEIMLVIHPYRDPVLAHIISLRIQTGKVMLRHYMPTGQLVDAMAATRASLKLVYKTIADLRMQEQINKK